MNYNNCIQISIHYFVANCYDLVLTVNVVIKNICYDICMHLFLLQISQCASLPIFSNEISVPGHFVNSLKIMYFITVNLIN